MALLKNTQNALHAEQLQDALRHIENYWQQLTVSSNSKNSTLIKLPNPYVVPSNNNGAFNFEEQYYWDSLFTSVGIYDEQLVTGMLDNLIFLFMQFGLIPNGNRYYFTSRSQPPILTTFIFHVYDTYHKSNEWLKEHIAVAKQEYETVWMSKSHPYHHNVFKNLSRYYDINHLHDLAEAESGWDMTPRFKRQCLDYLPIDLNCLLYRYEKDFERTAKIFNDKTEAHTWNRAAKIRQDTVNEYLWHKRKAFFFDYNFIDKKHSSVWSLASYYALWSGLATDEQAQKLVKKLTRFEKKGGLTTTSGTFMYAELFGSTKTQWAYPNCWAPLQYIVAEGLENYGYHAEAKRISTAWLTNCNNWFITHGEFLEKYNAVNPKQKPSQGLYPTQTGFGWTNGVFSYLAHKYIHA